MVRVEHPHWRANLAACVFGSFTTIVGMTVLVPYLPLYIRQLGTTDPAAVVRYSGIAFAATFFTAALTAPLWGWLGDRFGRKSMLIRASLGMAVAIALMGTAQSVWQLVALRLLTGLLGGYASGSMILVAAQAPKHKSSWALGVLSSGVMAGNVVGPLIGGIAPTLIGPRNTFFLSGALIFVAFWATVVFVHSDRAAGTAHEERSGAGRRPRRTRLPRRGPVIVLIGLSTLVTLSLMTIEPVLTVFVSRVAELPHPSRVAGVVFAIGAVGTIVSSPLLGRAADRFGNLRIVWVCLLVAGAALIAQSLTTSIVLFGAMRLVMGLALGGLMPAINAAIRHLTPAAVVGSILGLSVSAQYIGQVAGPLFGGAVGASFGVTAVFAATGCLLFIAAVIARIMDGRMSVHVRSEQQPQQISRSGGAEADK